MPLLIHPIHVTRRNPIIVVKMAANETTGYQWFWVPSRSATNLVKPLSYRYILPKKHLLGSPGFVVFTFRALPLAFSVPTILHLQFDYQRRWLSHAIKVQRYTVITAS